MFDFCRLCLSFLFIVLSLSVPLGGTSFDGPLQFIFKMPKYFYLGFLGIYYNGILKVFYCFDIMCCSLTLSLDKVKDYNFTLKEEIIFIVFNNSDSNYITINMFSFF